MKKSATSAILIFHNNNNRIIQDCGRISGAATSVAQARTELAMWPHTDCGHLRDCKKKKKKQFSHNCNTKILNRAILDSGGLRSTTRSVFEVLSQFDRPNQDKEAGLQLALVSCLPEPQVTHGTSRKNPHQVSDHTPCQVLAR